MIGSSPLRYALAALSGAVLWAAAPGEQLPATPKEIGRYGGNLVLAQRTEPKTLNPVTSVDATSREVIHRMMADLIHINRESQKTEAALAESWKISSDGRRYIVRLRRGIRFSDGHPFDADDVLFTFQVYLDEKIHSPQRDLLIVGGTPIAIHKTDSHTVVFELSQPYAAAERLFDSLAILPRHLLSKAYQDGTFAQVWNLRTPAQQIAGLGPFRLKEYVAGQRMTLERNPYYWKADRKGNRLPYLDAITFLFVAGEDAQVLRFQAGETDIVNRVGAKNFSVLAKQQNNRNYKLYDLGPGLEYNVLFFNLNDLSQKALPQIAREQDWFREVNFRQAVSSAVDRDGIVRLVYEERATPLWAHVTPGNRLWVNGKIGKPARSLERARTLLSGAGFSRSTEGLLIDAKGKKVEFSIITTAGNSERLQMATIIQDDLKQLGMVVHVVSLDSRSLLDRLLRSHEYEACVLGLGGGDTDPNVEMNVWLSSGGTHLWNLGQTKPSTGWEAEIDDLMRGQLVTIKYAKRKSLYDRVQELVAQYLPFVFLASPNILTAAKAGLGNFRPAILDHYTLWNAEELFWRETRSGARE